MNSRKGAASQTWKYEDKDSRRWDDCDDRQRADRQDVPWDFHNKYGRETHTNAERARRSNDEYRDSPKRLHSDDWNRRSPEQRHGPPSVTTGKDFDRDGVQLRRLSTEVFPERTTPEKRRCVRTQDKYRQYPEDFEHRSQEDFRYRLSPEKSNRRQQPESSYRPPPEHVQYRPRSEHGKDGEFHERTEDCMPERNSFTSKVYDKVGYRNNSPPSHSYKDHRTGFPMKNCIGQVFEDEHNIVPGPAHTECTPQQNSASKGFQRFLNVLNKGVDVCMLNKIVGQAHPVGDDTLLSQTSTAVKPCWSPPDDTRHQTHQNTPYPKENHGSKREAALEEEPRHLITEGHRRELQYQNESCFESGVGRCAQSDENSLEKNRAENNFSCRSRSPSLVAETKIKHEDEHKSKQMQNLLQAIGVDLGLDELGQMSDRIQERLYGKKESQRKEMCKGRDKESKRMFSPRCHSRSLSSDTSSFPLQQQASLRTDSFEAQSGFTDTCDRSSVIPVRVHDNERQGAFRSSFPIGAASAPEPSRLPVKPPSTAAPYSQYTYPAASVPPWGAPAAIPSWPYPSMYPPPMYPPIPPPMYPPHPSVPNVNTSSNAFPQATSMREITHLNLKQQQQPVNAIPQMYASRPRCLQVINTHSHTVWSKNAQDGKKHISNNNNNNTLKSDVVATQINYTTRKREDLDYGSVEKNQITLRLVNRK